MKWMLYLLTILLVGYLVILFSKHELASVLNEKYNLYVFIQIIHVILSLSVLFVVWSNDLYNKWKKIDQTLLVLFLTIIGLWFWFSKYYKNYVKFENEKANE